MKEADIDEAYIEAYCDLLRECPGFGEGEIAVIATIFDQGDGKTCEALLRNVGFVDSPGELEGVADGTITYSGSNARKCLDAIVRSCLPFEALQTIPECQEIFVGTLEVGETCRATSECVPTAYCADDFACAGTCTPRVAVGATCDSEEECLLVPNGFVTCRGTEENPEDHCVVIDIQTGRKAGETCGNIDESGDEQAFAACARGLYCRYGDEEVGTCAQPLASGSTCGESDQCVGGICDDGTCRSTTVVTREGDTCGFETLTFCDATDHLGCGEGGTCVRVGDGTVGSPCALESDFLLQLFTCGTELYCDLSLDVPTCQARRADGAVCEDDLQCESAECDDGFCVGPTLCSAPLDI